MLTWSSAWPRLPARSVPLLDCRDCPRIELPELHGRQIYAANEMRTSAWLSRTEAQSALVRLLGGPDVSGTCELYAQPDRVWLRARLRIPVDQIVILLDDLLPDLSTLSDAHERLSSGGQPIRPFRN